jgi:PAS domain S-box-containing protein
VGAAASDISEVARVRQELRASRDQLTLAMDAARMGAWDWDVAGGRLEWSGDLEAIHGMAPGSFDGTFESFLSAVHPDDREELEGAIAAALERRGPFEVEFRAVAEDGSIRWVAGEGRVVADAAGRAVRMIGIGRNITDERRAEEELRESDQRFRLMADSAPALIWVSDAAGSCTYFNAEWVRFTGRPMERHLGDGWLEAVHPHDRAGWRTALADAVRTRAPFEVECRLRRADGDYRWMLARGVPRSGSGSESFEGHVGSCTDVHDRREGQERERLLLEIGIVLERSLGVAERLDELVRQLLPDAADACVVDLLEPDGSLRRVTVAHVDPQAEALLASLPDPAPESPQGQVVTEGRARMFRDVGEQELAEASADAEQLERRRLLQVRSAVLVPLVARGVRTGVLTLFTGRAHSGRALDDDDLLFARAVARRAALAIDNARLYEAEHEAAERVRFLAEASRLLGGSLDIDPTLAALARLAVPFLGDWCSIDLVEQGGGLRSVATVHTDPDRIRRMGELRARYPPRVDAPTGPAAVIRTGEAQLVPAIDDDVLAAAAHDDEHLRLVRELGLSSYLCVPLSARGRVLGALSLAFAESGRRYDDDRLELARQLAERVAVAIDNAALFWAQRHIAETLQRALLPPELPLIPGAAAAARYLPMGEGVDAGGDFYDIFELDAGRWLVVVGDVCGKGPEAASLTALARYTLRALAPEQPDPARLLAALNGAILRQRPGNTQFLTACAIAVDRRGTDLQLEVACAGHPPPLVLRAGGGQEWVPARGGVVGVFPEIRLDTAQITLAPGERIVAYTDGVTEARAGDGMLGAEGLARIAAAPATGPEELAARIAEGAIAFQGGLLQDDVAVLVLEALSVEAPAPVPAARG